MGVEPVADAPAAVAALPGERALVVADYHAGLEAALRYDGVEIDDRADERREHLLSLLDGTGADRVVFLGDLAHWIGEPQGAERDEIATLLDAVTDRAPATLVKGNHDGEVEGTVSGDRGAEGVASVDVTGGEGVRLGDVGFVHGHTWPSADVLSADVVCVGHEHPAVRLEDAVGGRRIERAWLRGRLAPEAFEGKANTDEIDGDLVVFPAFNDLAGGTWVNVEGQGFLSPFLPEGLADGEAYLLDGTRLGDYRRI